MRACFLTITTTAEDREFDTRRDGEMELSPLYAMIKYREENASVVLTLQNKEIVMERTGDYSLRLVLEQGKIRKGSIGIGVQDGEIETFAKKIAYTIKDESVLLSLQYDLIIGGEAQPMKLRLFAKNK
ncbi:MAG: DUF1934 domain-containing protein [Clostridia bacterium]|nr:DUF1934 domain-containing protein [Clostridia bacterium]